MHLKTPAVNGLLARLPLSFLMLATAAHAATFQAESAALSGGAATASNPRGFRLAPA